MTYPKLEIIKVRTTKHACFSLLVVSIVLNSNLIEAQAKPENFKNWYPSSIGLPNGLNYDCALTALPNDLKGIPEQDKKYINHVYAMILKCAQAKTIMCDQLRKKDKVTASYSRYYYSTREALNKIRLEPTPKGLEPFRNKVIKAVSLQMVFFEKASKQAKAEVPYSQLMTISEGKQASSLLISAWQAMTSRYPSWSAQTKESIYHHLCALDLF